MHKLIKYMGIIAMVLFSFYYTEKIAIFVSNKNPLKQQINASINTYSVGYIDSVIDNLTIIPGLEGLDVNVNRSFNKMKKSGSFNPNNLIFDIVNPKVSLKDNMDKIIISGNKAKNMLSVIVDNNEEIIDYSYENNLKINVLYNGKIQDNLEYINSQNEEKEYKNVEKILDKNKINYNLCLVNYTPKNICQKHLKYLIKETLVLTSNNYALYRNQIAKGSIILIKSSFSLEEYKLLINDIKFKDINLNYLSILITEAR